MDQRERFEAWVTGGGLPVEHAANIDFFYPGAWGIWQAAEAAAPELAVSICDEHAGSATDYLAWDCAESIRKLAAPVERGGDKS
jgi:hypothetical protein